MTVGASAYHWEEDLLSDLFGNAGAVIDDLDTAHQVVACVADGELAACSRAQYDLTVVLLCQYLFCVSGDVQDRLN